MKAYVSPCLLIFVLFTYGIPLHAGDKTSVMWLPFEKGVSEAQRTGKKVMIDVYTDWCGWCKRMDRDTYANAEIADYLAKKYIAIRLNAESEASLHYRGESYTERELAEAFGITGYPSIIFLKENGEPITVYPGYANAQQFRTVLSYVADDHYLTTSFEDYTRAKK